MVAWCHEGPSRARVDAVEVSVRTAVGLAGFRIT
jgi:hypothetical protein